MSVYDDLTNIVKIEEEEYAKERAAIREAKQIRIKNLNIRRKNMIKTIAIAVAAGAGIALTAIGCSKAFEEKPLTVVTDELLSDAGLYITDNGKKIGGEMTEQELVDYIEENNLSLDDIKDKTESRLEFNGIDVDFGMDKVMDANPDVFEEETKGGMSK